MEPRGELRDDLRAGHGTAILGNLVIGAMGGRAKLTLAETVLSERLRDQMEMTEEEAMAYLGRVAEHDGTTVNGNGSED